MPAMAAKLAFGKGRAAVLLTGQDVEPYRLLANGFTFRFATIDDALCDLYAPAEHPAHAA